MHPYSTTSEERFKIAFVFACIAVGLAWIWSIITGKTHPPFWLEVPGTATLYLLLLGLFRTYLWKWSFFYQIGVVEVPDMSGDWKGYVTSSFDNLAQDHPVTMRIRQNWTHIVISLRADH